MLPLGAMGKSIMFLGAILLVVGALLWALSSVKGCGFIGRLPGDVYIHRGNFTFYFPLATCILISIILTLVLSLLTRR